MDKNVLKRFAIESRKHLHEKVADRYALYYLDEEFDEVDKDELHTLTNEKHNLVLTKEQYEHRQKLLKKKDRYGKEHVIEEAAFTWFNRFICLRYMEIHNFLPLGKINESLDIRVLSSRDGNKEPEILKRNNLANNSLDINIDIDKLEKITDINEKYEKVLLKVCEKMGKVLPQIFDGETDYIELLMPKNQLNVDSFLDKLLKEVPEDNFNDIEVIGWLYQYYNQSEKDRVMKEKRAYKKSEIPYVTQIFTPDWIVKYMVENSLGRLWIENTDDESLESEFKYFIKDNIEISVGTSSTSPLLPENITFIDPCMGSGHILVYAFEVFMKLYISAGYNKKDIPELILKNNLYGLDIDDRAGQFAIISVMLKAREYDSEIFNKIDFNSLNILSIPESSPELRQYANDIKDKEVREIVDYLIDTFENGKEIGSLLIVEEKDYDKVIKYFEEATPNIFNRLLWEGLKDIIRVAKILSKKYDVVVTNPPYMNGKFPIKLLSFLNHHYTVAKYDLYSAFIQQAYVLSKNKVSLIVPESWMFLSTYSEFRLKIWEIAYITTMLHLGLGAFDNGFGTMTFSSNVGCNLQFKSIYINLSDGNCKEDYINFSKCGKKYYCNILKFKTLPNNVMAYWCTDKLVNKIKDVKTLGSKAEISPGIKTGNNEMFLRLWHEVSFIKINDTPNLTTLKSHKYKWYYYNKGGGYKKWWGGYEYVVDFENNGENIKKNVKEETYRLRDAEDYFKNAILWPLIGTDNFSCRCKPLNCLSDVASNVIVFQNNMDYTIFGFMNSKVMNYLLKMINPTVSYPIDSIKNVPYIESNFNNSDTKVKDNIDIARMYWDSFETSWDFKKHPLV